MRHFVTHEQTMSVQPWIPPNSLQRLPLPPNSALIGQLIQVSHWSPNTRMNCHIHLWCGVPEVPPHMYVCMYVCMCVCVCVCKYVCVCMYVCMYVCVRMYFFIACSITDSNTTCIISYLQLLYNAYTILCYTILINSYIYCYILCWSGYVNVLSKFVKRNFVGKFNKWLIIFPY